MAVLHDLEPRHGNAEQQQVDGDKRAPQFSICLFCKKELRALGVGAHIAGLFMGAACFADDVVLIAPSRQAMQIMLNQVENFASRYNISFSTEPCPGGQKEWFVQAITFEVFWE